MKVLFICGCLEFGRDGVGDYTRILSSEIINQGHQSAIIAFNDPHLLESEETYDTINGVDVQVMRLPSLYSLNQRIMLAKQFTNNFNPDWVSIQFVIFSFHPKGISFTLSKALLPFAFNRKLHIMFHELWVGMPVDSSLKHRVWGSIQKQLIKSLISNLRPDLISTQCKLYYQQLQKLGYSVHYLPLFSNIPKTLKDNYVISTFNDLPNDGRTISLVVFGTIHPSVRFLALIEEVNRFVEKNKVKVSLTIIGRCGMEVDVWEKMWREQTEMPINIKGEQPLNVISQVLGSADIGISTSALPMIDKSGTVAAMIEHDLPVICVGQVWSARGLKTPNIPSGIFDVSEGCIEKCLSYINLNADNKTLSGIAQDLIIKMKSSL